MGMEMLLQLQRMEKLSKKLHIPHLADRLREISYFLLIPRKSLKKDTTILDIDFIR